MKKIIPIIAAMAVCVSLSAQNVLPNDSQTKVGKLDNGLTYFIRHNDTPAQKCEFYLVTNAGAINQDKGQDGLAHFLEHMCFNGLKNLPGKQMLEYLQSIGASFGGNINAGTGVDVTSYMLNNIPIVREGILDTCLLVMHDYSHFVLNNPEEIDAERGVILEEKRTRNTARWRTLEQSCRYIYGDSKYATAYADLIGSEQTLKTFTPETLVEFYHTWYRPDKQAVIVVGDIDVDAVEAKLKALFADIPAPENPKELEEIVIPDNDKPLVGIITDPETTGNTCAFYWRRPAVPWQFHNSDQYFVVSIVEELVSNVMSERFNDIASAPGAPFVYAGLDNTFLTKSCDALNGIVSFKNGEDCKAIEAFLYQVEKLRRYGVTEAELQRAKDNIISSLEKRVQGASSRKNPEFINPIMEYFIYNTPYLDPSTELELTKGIFSQINAGMVNQLAAQFITDKNISVVLSGPSQVAHPDEAQIIQMLENSRTMEVEAPAAEEISTALVDEASIKSGKIRKTAPTICGAEEWTLSNGVKVVVLPTQHKKDEVVFNLYLNGGKSLIEDSDLYTFDDNITNCIDNFTGVGEFSNSQLPKMLAGKIVSMSPYFKDTYHGISGTSSPKDIETALQLMYLEFTHPRFDADEFEVAFGQLRTIISNMESTPQMQFSKHLMKSMHEDGDRNFFISSEVIDKASLETYSRVYCGTLFKDVSGAVLYVVGNVDKDSLKPLVEKYVGSLPKGKKPASYIDRGERLRAGTFEDRFSVKMEAPKVSVFHFYNVPFDPTVENRYTLNALQYILQMKYTDTLREEEGGTYGAQVSKAYVRQPEKACYIYTYFDTNVDQVASLEELAKKGLKEIALDGPSDDYLARTKEYSRAQLPQSRINNRYWLDNLMGYYRFNENYDAEIESTIENLTKEKISALAARLIDSGNFGAVVMSPEEK